MAGLNCHPLLSVRGSSWTGVRYGCTTRAGGVSSEPWGPLNLALHVDDDIQAVQENRRRLAAGLPGTPRWLEQVHGNSVVEFLDTKYIYVSGDDPRQHAVTDAPSGAPPAADAAITVQAGVVLAIMTADCLPVVLADIDGKAVGVAHAGWKGMAAGVLENTLLALRQRVPQSRGWRAWIGPGIGQASFEVGDEVRAVFADIDPASARYFEPGRQTGKWQADLAGLACHHLATLGVYGVELAGLCTYERADLFHSYRRSAVSGRMATLAWLNPPSKN